MSTHLNEPTADEREALWTQFLARWPLERLSEMTLLQYNQAGDDDHFCRWLEKHTEALGSIWGGSSLKFGIYSRSGTASKEPSAQKGVLQDVHYGWYAKYGATPDEAFAKVRQLIVHAAQAARAGRLDEVESIDLWPIFRRKIAFLYQDRQDPCLLPIYLRPMLQLAWQGDTDAPQDAASLYRGIMAQRGNRGLMAFYQDLLVNIKAARAQQATAQASEVLSHFAAVPDLANRLQAAGQAEAFCRLALALNEAGLDWWITGTQAMHAGRTDDPKVWQTAVALELECTAQGLRGRLNTPGDGTPPPAWQMLDSTLAEHWAEQAAADGRVPELSGREACWPDDYNQSSTTLSVLLSGGAVRNGYIKVPKLQALFPVHVIAADEKATSGTFQLILPNGAQVETCLLANRGRIKARFNGLFNQLGVQEGDRALIQKEADGIYRLLINATPHEAAASALPTSTPTRGSSMSSEPLNQILYGPPGTGKTYGTIEQSLRILDPAFWAAQLALADPVARREAMKYRFDALRDAGRIQFVTFHQSFSYEDFVEGLRAFADDETGQVRYEVVDGVFKSLCLTASVKVGLPSNEGRQSDASIDLSGRRIWKMSLGNTQGDDAAIYDECIENGLALLGYGSGLDFTGCKSRSEIVERLRQGGRTINAPQNDYEVTAVSTFVNRIKPRDLLVVTDGNFKFRAIGEVTGDSAFRPHGDYDDGYSMMRPVKWLRTWTPSLPHTELMNNQFSQMTLYELRPGAIDLGKLQALLGVTHGSQTVGPLQPGVVEGGGYTVLNVSEEMVELTKPNGNRLAFARNLLQTLVDGVVDGSITIDDIRAKQAVDKLEGKGLEPYLVNGYANVLAPLVERMLGVAASGFDVKAKGGSSTSDARVLIIDEINRGNVSRIFGELITLIEPSKRQGRPEELSTTLPYSRKSFSVPSNVYILGTMNTADRSLASLDIALRRRFAFIEVPPQPELLSDVVIANRVNVADLLAIVNQRVEALLDRDHLIGHACFMPLVAEPSLPKLSEVFRRQVLPLLQEYFFEDWQRIQWVLNDHRKPKALQFVRQSAVKVADLFGANVQVSARPLWEINEAAFDNIEAYVGVISSPASSTEEVGAPAEDAQ